MRESVKSYAKPTAVVRTARGERLERTQFTLCCGEYERRLQRIVPWMRHSVPHGFRPGRWSVPTVRQNAIATADPFHPAVSETRTQMKPYRFRSLSKTSTAARSWAPMPLKVATVISLSAHRQLDVLPARARGALPVHDSTRGRKGEAIGTAEKVGRLVEYAGVTPTCSRRIGFDLVLR